MKIGMLTMEAYENRRPHSVGSSRIRGHWVEKYSEMIEPWLAGHHYDAVIYQKAYYLDHIREYQGLKIFDLCDPDWLDGRPVIEMIELMDLVTVPTDALRDYLQQLTDKPVVTIPDRMDLDYYPITKQNHHGPLRTVAWFGYSQNFPVLDKTLIPLHNEGIKLVVISNEPYRDADVFVKYDQETINEELMKHDAVLNPTNPNDEKFKFKSNNKTLTAWALGMPVISELDHIEQFMDPIERAAEGKRRRSLVEQEYNSRFSAEEMEAAILELASNKK